VTGFVIIQKRQRKDSSQTKTEKELKHLRWFSLIAISKYLRCMVTNLITDSVPSKAHWMVPRLKIINFIITIQLLFCLLLMHIPAKALKKMYHHLSCLWLYMLSKNCT